MTDGFIDYEDALRIHREQLVLFGGEEGVLNESNLLSALGAIVTAYHYGKQDIDQLAALYISRIAQAHACVDGNKRTAASCAIHFLEFHDIHTGLTSSELESLVLNLVDRKISEEGAAAFLLERIEECVHADTGSAE